MTDVASQGPAASEADRAVLTNRQGHPIYDNQNQRTVGSRGPATLENYQFLEKISHFDRERIPERVVHARGATAFGVFVADGTVGDEPISTYTRAKLFQEKGKETEVALRFSTVAGGRDSSEAARDPRGFAVKFYTEDGNWDLVGNNLGVFFIRDAIKFPDFIHSQKPDPVTFERQVANRVFDFWSQSPEALHMMTLVLSPRGLPASYRTMQGFGVNTYKWVNAAGETKLVKYHWLPKQGVKSWTEADAAVAQGNELGVHTKDLYEAIERGEFPSWDLHVQLMDDHDHPELDFDPLDDTKVWPENEFPLRKVGTLTLNRTPQDFFTESEQIAFGTGVLVDGLDFSDDKMLVGRTFSYSDTQRYRVGPNYLQLPVNQPKGVKVATNQRDGAMAYGVDLGPGQNPHVNYEPSILGGLREAEYPTHDEQGPEITGRLTRKRIDRTDDYTQAGQRYLLSEQWEKDDLVANLIANLSQCDRPIQERMMWHLFMAEDELGQRVGEGLGISADDVRGMQPLQTQTLTEAELQRAANLGKNGPRDVSGLTMTHCVPNEHVVLAK
ncbi:MULTISPECIES: catalase [unclassified Modestobacter]|uniref:catalase n=1 Tax=unclassified Modestobacter TaxID=2643866 RepID=UPI0022AA65ED|nr:MULTISPECIES: catalase [unclassified Modestobacter]MCZ2814046.1 catalase [Modestobacter sp. VKM Ac-2979]MCZ2844538.1 catalase [Modestobacter sp. VKM Ac-2980]MCZ2848928.1 catalase [Modestobacter sp. VKM Ac-2978]